MTQSRPTPGSTPLSAPQSPDRLDRNAERQLFAAVRAALHTLASAAEGGQATDAALEGAARERVTQFLRAVVTLIPAGSGPYGEAVVAVTAACADLDDGDLPGAYLALRAADTALREAAPPDRHHHE